MVPRIGYKHSEETKKKISKKVNEAIAKGVMPEPWNKGKKNVYTKEQLERISKATKNAMARPEVREKIEKAGKMFKKGERSSKETEFKKGQISHNKGVKYSEELRKKMSIAGKLRYSKMSKEERKVFSDAHIGKKQSLEGRKNMSIAQTKRIDRLRPEYRKKLSLARRNVKLPKKDTKPEKFLQKLLRENNIIFETHKAILGQPDIFIKPNFCIFMDGDRYHANPEEYSDDKIIWNEYHRKGRHIPAQTAKMIREKDKRITDNLKKEGFKVIRFWQSELEEETEKGLKKIRRFTKSL
jgi:DNA mismatch endonuclease, patch repair protein